MIWATLPASPNGTVAFVRQPEAAGQPHIRAARPDEAAALIELQRRASLTAEDTRADLLAHPEVIAIPADAFTDGRVRVAVEDGRHLGFHVVLEVGRGACELDGLFVEPGDWKKGTGRALIEDAAAWARAHGAERIEVTANPNALGFYQRLGFTGADVVATQFGPGYRMFLDISGG